MERKIPFVFALFVLLNEIILGFSDEIGVIMYLVLMSLSLILLAREETFDEISQMIIVLLAVPLVRISVLFLDVSYIWKIGLGYGIFLFLGIYYICKFRVDIGKIGRCLWAAPLLVLLGFLFGFIGNVLFVGERGLILIMALPLIVFSEEIFFRGLMQNVVEKSSGVFYSIVIPAVIYAALSSYLGLWLAILFFMVNLFSGIVYYSTRNLFLSIIFNLSVSVVVFVVPRLA